MVAGPHHRSLADQLRTWTKEQVAALLERRPDLAAPETPTGIGELADAAQREPSIAAAISTTTLAENRLLQVIVCLQRDPPVDALERALPAGSTLAGIETVLASLEAAALVWRHGGRIHCSETLRQCMPTTLGPPLRRLAEPQTVEFLKHATAVVRSGVAPALGETVLPPRAAGPSGKAPRKAELIDELEALLSVPGAVAALLAGAPAEADQLARAMAEGRPVVPLPSHLYYSPYSHNSYYGRLPEWWLYERALLLPDARYGDAAAQPRCVGVALREGVPVSDLAIESPALVVAEADQDTVDQHAAAAAQRTLHRLSDILDRWAAEPAKPLKSGGLGVSVMRTLSAAIEVPVEEAGRLVELLHLSGLLTEQYSTRKQGRHTVYDMLVTPSDAAGPWTERSPGVQWRQIATAWLRAARWPSASGRKHPGSDKTMPVLATQYGPTDAPGRRADLLASLAELDNSGDRAATSAAALAEYTYWKRPQPWLSNPAGNALTAAGWIYEEALVLGIVADGRLSSFGRALVAGKSKEAEHAFTASLPEATTSFLVQADMTVVVVGELARDLLTELRLFADVEVKGDATTFRMSEATIRRAIDSGRDGETIVGFLQRHAAKAVPRPVEYMVRDVARRHGHLRVGAAATVVCSDDPAVLADACSHRRTRKLKLQPVAPTVAVSALAPDKVLAGLRDAGFFPTVDGAAVAVSGSDAQTVAAAGKPNRPANTKQSELPERFRGKQGGTAEPHRLEPQIARVLAAQILAGKPAPKRPRTEPEQRLAPPDDLPFDLAPFDDEDLQDLGEVLLELEDADLAEVVFLGSRQPRRRQRGRRGR